MASNSTQQCDFDLELAQRAVATASINALRIALYHQTQDTELAEMRVAKHELRGGALSIPVIDRKYHEVIQRKAVDYLADLAAGRAGVKPAPDRAQTGHLLTMFTGKAPNELELAYAFEELAFEDPPRDCHWQSEPDPSKIANFKVTVVGSGVSGLAMGVQLGRLGIPYQIIERHPQLGGTWYVNDYPEARVDVPTFGYQYKFEKDYQWKHFFAPRDELLDYANYIADKYQVREHIRFSTELKSASWDDRAKRWQLALLDKNSNQLHSESSHVLISASGLFSTPKKPNIPGVDAFQGKMFHTTEWDHQYDLSGKRVALIGTGSTGTQLARHVAKECAQLTVFQRTPNWVTPINGYHAEISEELQWLMDNMPGYRSWFTYSNTASEFDAQDLHVIDPEYVAKGGKVNKKNSNLRDSLTEFIKIKTQAKPQLFEHLVPTHSPMARRLVIDNEWYDTLMRDNVDLVPLGVESMTENGVVDSDGNTHEVDLVILSAGFEVAKYFWPVQYCGNNDRSLEQLWAHDGARAFKGISLPDFPNFFVVYGPNAQLRAGTFHSVIEVITRYIAGFITHLIENDFKAVEVKQEIYQDYNRRLDAAMQDLLWAGESGEGSYYVNSYDRVGVLAPWRLHEFYEMVRFPDFENFKFSQ